MGHKSIFESAESFFKTRFFCLTVIVSFISPYVIWHYAVFLFFIPVLCVLYSGTKIDAYFIAGAVIAAGLIILLPVIIYNPFIYIISVIISVSFVLSFPMTGTVNSEPVINFSTRAGCL